MVRIKRRKKKKGMENRRWRKRIKSREMNPAQKWKFDAPIFIFLVFPFQKFELKLESK